MRRPGRVRLLGEVEAETGVEGTAGHDVADDEVHLVPGGWVAFGPPYRSRAVVGVGRGCEPDAVANSGRPVGRIATRFVSLHDCWGTPPRCRRPGDKRCVLNSMEAQWAGGPCSDPGRLTRWGIPERGRGTLTRAPTTLEEEYAPWEYLARGRGQRPDADYAGSGDAGTARKDTPRGRTAEFSCVFSLHQPLRYP